MKKMVVAAVHKIVRSLVAVMLQGAVLLPHLPVKSGCLGCSVKPLQVFAPSLIKQR